MKKVMVVAGGDWQVDLVKKAKELGYYVICSNLYEDSPAFKYADASAVADVLDKERNLEIAKKYMPDAIITDQSDIAVTTVAYLNEKLGLKGIGLDKANIFTDKSLLRSFCKQNNITIPDFRICETVQEALEMLKKYKKIVIKPIDSQSSRGVYTIRSKEELINHYEETISFSNRRKVFLAEEYVGGDEFTVDGLVVNGNHYPLCVSVKEMYDNDYNVSKVQTYTKYHDIYDYDLLRKINHDLITKIGLPFGLTHTEYKFFNGKYYLIETAARGGGTNLSSRIVPFMSNIDNYYYYIKSALNEYIDDTALKNLDLPNDKCVIMQFLDFGEGIVKSIKGKSNLFNNPNILDYQIKIKPGDVLENPKYGSQRPGHINVKGKNEIETKDVLNKVLNSIKVELEK